MEKSIFIHKTADVHPLAVIGEGTRIWQYTIVSEGVVIGKDCNICSHCFIETGVRIGNRVTIKNGVYLWNGVMVEDDVFIGPNATFVNDSYPRSKRYKQWEKTMLRRGCSIGAGAVILPVEIGSYAVVGAGAVVTRDIPPHEVWVGNPAKRVGYACICGRVLKDIHEVCPECKTRLSDLLTSKELTKHMERR